jgi:hypothetical protein
MAAKLEIVKSGDESKKKCSLKLLSQSQPNFAEMANGFRQEDFYGNFP